MKKILDPVGSGTVAGFPKGVMPPMFGQSLTAKEYVDLVSFLMTLNEAMSFCALASSRLCWCWSARSSSSGSASDRRRRGASSRST